MIGNAAIYLIYLKTIKSCDINSENEKTSPSLPPQIAAPIEAKAGTILG